MRAGDSQFRAIGQPLRRKEDDRLVIGQGRFSDDFCIDGQAYAVMVRAPHAHARIKSYDYGCCVGRAWRTGGVYRR